MFLKHSSLPSDNATNDPKSSLIPFRLGECGRALRMRRATSALVYSVVGTDVGFSEGCFEESCQRLMSLDKSFPPKTQLYGDLNNEDHTDF